MEGSFRLDGQWGPRHGHAPGRILSWRLGEAGDPFALLERALAEPGWALAVGYLSYDLGRAVERIPETARRELAIPDLWVAFYERVGTGPGPAATGPCPRAAAPPRPGLPGDAYRAAVADARHRLAAGDLYQVNLTQRISVPLVVGGDPLALYERMLAPSPARFAAYLDCGGFQVVGASPERLLAFDPRDRRLRTEPIKGTAPRGPGQARRLRASAKDRAEHVMIVDLMRNDLGRVCVPGTVGVEDMLRCVDLPTVHHLVSTVRGELRPGVGLADTLRAVFPGGSVTGAPKVQAMRVIEALEPVRRGPYCGGLGWFRPDGAFDISLAIRTAVVMDRQAHVHAGGGVVIDSTPDGEHDECWLKARAFLAALGVEERYGARRSRSASQTPPPS